MSSCCRKIIAPGCLLLALVLSALFCAGPALAAPGDLKWQTQGFQVGTSPAIDASGTLYVGQNWPGSKVYAVSPTDGSAL